MIEKYMGYEEKQSVKWPKWLNMPIDRQPQLTFCNIFAWLIICLIWLHVHKPVWFKLVKKYVSIFVFKIFCWTCKLSHECEGKGEEKSVDKPCGTPTANLGKLPKLPMLLSHYKWRYRRSINDKQEQLLQKYCTNTIASAATKKDEPQCHFCHK